MVGRACEACTHLHVEGHPEFAREEVVVFKGELWRNVRVETFLKWQRDTHTNRLTTGHVSGAAIRRLHETRPTAGADVDGQRLRFGRIGRAVKRRGGASGRHAHVACVAYAVHYGGSRGVAQKRGPG